MATVATPSRIQEFAIKYLKFWDMKQFSNYPHPLDSSKIDKWVLSFVGIASVCAAVNIWMLWIDALSVFSIVLAAMQLIGIQSSTSYSREIYIHKLTKRIKSSRHRKNVSFVTRDCFNAYLKVHRTNNSLLVAFIVFVVLLVSFSIAGQDAYIIVWFTKFAISLINVVIALDQIRINFTSIFDASPT